MPDKAYIKSLRIPTAENPLRILVSACLIGVKCGVDGDNYGEYPSDPTHIINKAAKDFDQHEWYLDYFKKGKEG